MLFVSVVLSLLAFYFTLLFLSWLSRAPKAQAQWVAGVLFALLVAQAL